MLRVIKRLKEKSNVSIKSSFLGAYILTQPPIKKPPGIYWLYHQRKCGDRQKKSWPDYIDVFCENRFFPQQKWKPFTKLVCNMDLKPKLHINQLNSIGGLQAAIKLKCCFGWPFRNNDRRRYCRLKCIKYHWNFIANSCILLRMQYQSARKLIDSNCHCTGYGL